MHPLYSIIVVCLNPGEKLKETLESIAKQDFRNYEVIVKDGISKDGSLKYAEKLVKSFQQERMEKEEKEVPDATPGIRIIQKKDTGIYDAMNQAVEEATGRYLYFLNCGDRFYSEDVLGQMADFIIANENTDMPGIFYGNIFERLTRQQVTSNPHIDAFGCYRNVPCHQACFYDRRLLLTHPFETIYRVRADYEQFLWCFFKGPGKGFGVRFRYKELLIVDYEGGGFSETRENRRISQKEHKEITQKYIPGKQLFKFKLIMWLTLSPLRTRLAENEKTAGIYNRLKRLLYSHRQ